MDPTEAARILDEQLERGRALIAAADTTQALEEAKTAVLGRKAPLAGVQSSLGSLPADEKRDLGRRTNEVFAVLREALAARGAELEERLEDVLLEGDAVDVTLPGRRPRSGSLHPLSIVEDRIVEIFTRMGYRVAQGPEIEDEWHNFGALNIPPDHPARTLKDSLYVDVPDMLLRTETSAVQIRTMQAQQPPVHVVVPGRVYRREAVDATHLSVFHQVEGLAVDEGISFADMKGTLEAFARELFGPDIRVRLSPDYFPFVEPGAQVAVSCFVCHGAGCRTCKHTGWIELLGCGMVHPNVLVNVGYDPERYTGYAAGTGIERVAMVRYGIPDLRLFYDGDVRFVH